MLSLMKLGPDSAGCHGEAAKTLASVTLSRCFQWIGRALPALGALLSRSRLGHTCGCSPAESTHRQGGEGARGSCEHQAHFTVFSSSKAPQSKVLLPAGYSPTPLLHLPHSSPNPHPHPLPTRPIDTAPGIFRISWWQGWGVTLSQATLGCLHPVVRDGGAILFQPCGWFPFSSHQTYIIST